MKRPYKVMVLQNDNMTRMYQTEDVSMIRAITAVENTHKMYCPSDKFRITYVEEIIE